MGQQKYMPQMSHIWQLITSCADIRQLCQYIYLTWTHRNQQSDQQNWYTHISHYCHIPPNKYACCNTHTSNCMSTICMNPESLHISVKRTTKCNFNPPCCCHICTRDKYAPQIPHVCQIPKLLNVHPWGKYANMYPTY